MYEAPVSNVLVGLADATNASTVETTTTAAPGPTMPKLTGQCL